MHFTLFLGKFVILTTFLEIGDFLDSLYFLKKNGEKPRGRTFVVNLSQKLGQISNIFFLEYNRVKFTNISRCSQKYQGGPGNWGFFGFFVFSSPFLKEFEKFVKNVEKPPLEFRR